MSCDYYIDSFTTIEYISEAGGFCTLTTDLCRKQKYISREFGDGDDVLRDQHIERKVAKHTRKKIVYDKGNWVREKYRQIFERRIRREFRYMHIIKKIYIDCVAFKPTEMRHFI